MTKNERQHLEKHPIKRKKITTKIEEHIDKGFARKMKKLDKKWKKMKSKEEEKEKKMKLLTKVHQDERKAEEKAEDEITITNNNE